MKHLHSAFILLFFSFVSISTNAQERYAPGDLIIQFAENAVPQEVIEDYEDFLGFRTDMSIGNLLSEHMNIYLVHFRTDFIEDRALLQALRNDERVSLAQFNHFVKQRDTIIPNDLNFGQQWHHYNTGQMGGTPGADIGSVAAWDITTGGLTADGDTIVVCILEGGNLNHPDLIDNAWRNYNEIPDNGIDDDGNGFVDDFEGWNVSTQSDGPLASGTHGTQVMGMIGAKGENGQGVTGINWNVKLMGVRGYSISDEASVVAAYNYPLVMRKLYNETDGERGAFVVATNASWGIDNGDMEEYPVWDAFYDSLGVYGILNCGATANNNVNVDQVGDVPTASDSDYMISVTATNRNDVRTFSGYGLTTIDLGAPGEDVFTTTGNQGYNSTSGTSFASPLTAGVIALLYSAPCSTFMQVVKQNPQLGADYVRYALFEGVDVVPDLEGFVATGGRVNAYNSLKIIMDNCGTDICLPPFSFDYTLSNDTVYDFGWNAFENQVVTIRYKAEGDEDWTFITGVDVNQFTFIPPALCTTYTFEIAPECTSSNVDSLVFGSPRVFETKGCCVAPPQVEAFAFDTANAEVSWVKTFALEDYAVYIRPDGAQMWELLEVSEEEILSIGELAPCTFYDVSVVPTCLNDPDSGTIARIRTKGCGVCIDGEYCDSRSESADFEFIQLIFVGDWGSNSGNNGGYLLNETWGASFEIGAEYNLSLNPGFTFFPIPQTWRVWIDLDQDGAFSNDELVAGSLQSTDAIYNDTFIVPEDALPGTTRMRISMKRAENASTSVQACEAYSRGETEDYCIELLTSTLSAETASITDFQIYPNPSTGNFQYRLNSGHAIGALQLQVIDLTGKLVVERQLLSSDGQIDLRDLDNGMYLYTLRGERNSTHFQQSGKLVISR